MSHPDDCRDFAVPPTVCLRCRRWPCECDDGDDDDDAGGPAWSGGCDGGPVG